MTSVKLFLGPIVRSVMRPRSVDLDEEGRTRKKKVSSTSPETDKTLKCIALGQDRPQLWQKEHREFLDRGIRTKLFKELAQMCGLSCVSRCHTQVIVRIDLDLI